MEGLVNTPSPSEIREALQSFADGMRPGWKVYEDDRIGSYAGRRFEYRSGARALLSAQPSRYLQDMTQWMTADPLDLVKEWSAQVNVPFAAGPEVATSGKYAQVEDWVSTQEKALAMPFKLQECKSREAAETMAEGITGGALVLLAAVFDIDYTQGRKPIVQELAKVCGPARRPL